MFKSGILGTKSGDIEFNITSNYEFLNFLSSGLPACTGGEFTMKNAESRVAGFQGRLTNYRREDVKWAFILFSPKETYVFNAFGESHCEMIFLI